MTNIPEPQGLQPERTALAWQRTALTATVALVPPLVVDARLRAWGLLAAGLVATVVAAWLVFGVGRRISQLREADVGPSPWLPMWRVAAVAVLAAAGGTVTALRLILA